MITQTKATIAAFMGATMLTAAYADEKSIPRISEERLGQFIRNMPVNTCIIHEPKDKQGNEWTFLQVDTKEAKALGGRGRTPEEAILELRDHPFVYTDKR